MALLTLVLSLFLSPALAQPTSVGSDRFAGLNDSTPANVLRNEEAQDALNVEASLDATALLKRRGFQEIAALTVTTAPVTGAYQFIDPNGNQQTIVCQDRNCAVSTNGGAFSVIYSTANSAVKRWSFVDINGTVYAVNDKNDQPWSYNGTTFTIPFSTSVALGSLIELTKDRTIVGGTTANPNRLAISQSGAYTTFAIGAESYSAWTEDFGTPGDKVTAIKYDGGNLYVFKRTSITACTLRDQYSTTCYPVSNVIGTNSPASIVSAPDGLYFQSQTGAYYRMPTYGQYGLELISKKISVLVKSQPSQLGSTGSNVQASQDDWNAGLQTPSASWNTSTTPGSIFNASTTFKDTSATDWDAGTKTNISTSDVSGSITLSSDTFKENCGDGNLTANPAWTMTAGSYICSNGAIAEASSGANMYASNSVSSGAFSFSYYSNKAGSIGIVKFMSAGSGAVTDSAGYGVRIDVDGAGSSLTPTLAVYPGATTLCTGASLGSVSAAKNYQVIRSTLGVLTLYIDGTQSCTATNTASAWSSFVIINTNSDSQIFDDLNFSGYKTSGTIVSRVFDTGYSSATWGQFSSTFTVNQNVEGQVVYYVHSSSSPNNDMWGAWVASSDTLKPDMANKRYVQYQAKMQTIISTKTPSIQDIALTAATTGQFRTQCIQPGANITAWGILSCDVASNVGLSSEVFYATSAATCGGLPSGQIVDGTNATVNGWTAQTNNATMTISTNAAVYIGFRSLLGSATDQAQINSCLVNWANGVQPQSVFGTYDSINNSIYWATAKDSLGTNNRLLKYDLNLAEQGIAPWFPFDIKATAMRMVNNSLYFGHASSGTWNQYGDVDADNGVAYSAYWKSKDWSCGNPFLDADWLRSSASLKNNASGNVTQTLTNLFGTTDSYTISTSTTSTIPYVRATHNIKKLSPSPFMNIKFSNSSANQPFEVHGYKIDCTPQPFRDQNP